MLLPAAITHVRRITALYHVVKYCIIGYTSVIITSMVLQSLREVAVFFRNQKTLATAGFLFYCFIALLLLLLILCNK